MANINIKMIAERIKLSSGTVSIVLNGRGNEMRIAQETQNRIWEEAKKLGYKPNIYARRLRQQSGEKAAAVIGILWPSLYSSEQLVRFFDGIQNSILNDKMKIEVVFKPYRLNEIETIENVFRNQLYNGVIIVGASNNDIEYIGTLKCTMPIVFFNRQSDKFGSVCVDEYKAGEKVSQLMAARGHKTAGLIEVDLLRRNFSMRKAGFLDACRQYGITVAPEHIIQESLDKDGGRLSMEKLLKSGTLPTVLFFSAVNFVPTAYSVLQQNEIRIPQDMEIIGYTDILSSVLLKPSLTVIDTPIQKMVKKCLELILDMINGRILDSHTIYEETHFIFRESCGGFPDSK